MNCLFHFPPLLPFEEAADDDGQAILIFVDNTIGLILCITICFSAGQAERAFITPILPHPIVGDDKSESRPMSNCVEKPAERGQPITDKTKSAGNHPDLCLLQKNQHNGISVRQGLGSWVILGGLASSLSR
jgi:hypothetical protein